MANEYKPFEPKRTIRCGYQLLDLTQPKVMGILNVTPDSFYDGGKHFDQSNALQQAKQLLEEGADFIDIGGYSSRPGAEHISLAEELNRTIPIIEAVAKRYPNAILSVDTFRSKVAQKALDAGALMVNDIYAGTGDDQMVETVAKNQVPYILMHIQGTPQTMQKAPNYQNVTKDIIQFLSERVDQMKRHQINDVIIDPGFGFGKSVDHNFTLLKQLKLFKFFELPIMVGLSRKSMIKKVLDQPPAEALNGSTVLNTMALLNGAGILRVHDVKQAKEAIQLVDYYKAVEVEQ